MTPRRLRPRHALSSVDVLVEGVHFRRDWVEARSGAAAVAVNVADIEAMGGRAVGMLAGFSARATCRWPGHGNSPTACRPSAPRGVALSVET